MTALVLGILVIGCKVSPPPPGGDTPVTTQRLTGTRLKDIRHDLTWTFGEKVVVIDNNHQPIPADLLDSLLGDATLMPKRIEADWQLDEETGLLHLSGLSVDGEMVEGEVAISIKPAGHVRVNLGQRQYNMFRDKADAP